MSICFGDYVFSHTKVMSTLAKDRNPSWDALRSLLLDSNLLAIFRRFLEGSRPP